MKPLYVKNGVSYELLDETNLNECVDLMAEVFSVAEPLTRLVEITQDEFRQFAEINCRKAVRERMAVIARDPGSGQLLGFNVSEDLGTEPPVELKLISSKFKPIVDILGQLVAIFAQTEEIKPGRFMHIFMIGLKPGKTNPSLAIDLMNASLECAQKLGFHGAIGEVTSYLSARLGRRCGFEERAAIYYDEYTFDGKKVFAELGHTSCRLMVRKFDQDTSSSGEVP